MSIEWGDLPATFLWEDISEDYEWGTVDTNDAEAAGDIAVSGASEGEIPISGIGAGLVAVTGEAEGAVAISGYTIGATLTMRGVIVGNVAIPDGIPRVAFLHDDWQMAKDCVVCGETQRVSDMMLFRGNYYGKLCGCFRDIPKIVMEGKGGV
jgi:hypothetical protein